MRPPPPELILSLIGALVVLGGLAVWWLAADARKRQFQTRVAQVVAPYARARPPGASMAQRLTAMIRLDAVHARLGKTFGYVPHRIDQYPIAWWLVILIALGVAFGASRPIAPLLGVAANATVPGLWIMVARAIFKTFHRRRSELLYRQFPDALAMIVRAVRAGIPVSEAVRTVARECAEPTATEFARLSDQLAIGYAFDAALRDLAKRTGLNEYNFFATALALQQQTGGGLTETLENLADVIRRRVAMRNRAIALAGQAKTSAAILAGVPFVAGGALAIISPDYIAVLFDDPRGQKVFAAAVISLGLGILTMRQIIRSALS